MDGEGATGSYSWGGEKSAKHRDPEAVPGFLRCSAQGVGAEISRLWESGFGPPGP